MVESGRMTRSTEEWLISRSCHSATFSRAARALVRTSRARPLTFSLPTGLRLCGMELEPFWPSANGSSASRISVRWRDRIALEAEQAADLLLDVRVDVGERADRPRDLPDPHGLLGPIETLDVAPGLGIPQRRLEPEHHGLGVDAVAAPDAERALVAERKRAQGAAGAGEVGQLDLEPGLVLGVLAPEPGHLRAGIARDHTWALSSLGRFLLSTGPRVTRHSCSSSSTRWIRASTSSGRTRSIWASISSTEWKAPKRSSCFASRFILEDDDSSESMRLPLRWSFARASSSAVTPSFLSARTSWRKALITLPKLPASVPA